MQLEHEMTVVPIDANFEGALAALKAQGWEMVPGVTPVAVYHLVRIKPEAQQQPVSQPMGLGKLHIDESKIGIVRNGKFVDGA